MTFSSAFNVCRKGRYTWNGISRQTGTIFNDDERGGSTCDIEFQKGRFNNVFHKEDSMYLWDDHFWILDITTLFVEVLPEFDMCTEGCEINEEQRAAIVEASKRYSQITQQIVAEMNPWMRDAIGEYGCVTVLGV